MLWQGRWYAVGNRCTKGFQLHSGYIEDGCLRCPIHYSVYDLETGLAKGGPVTVLPKFKVRVQGDAVHLSLTR